jgi:hypothetical protein
MVRTVRSKLIKVSRRPQSLPTSGLVSRWSRSSLSQLSRTLGWAWSWLLGPWCGNSGLAAEQDHHGVIMVGAANSIAKHPAEYDGSQRISLPAMLR